MKKILCFLISASAVAFAGCNDVEWESPSGGVYACQIEYPTTTGGYDVGVIELDFESGNRFEVYSDIENCATLEALPFNGTKVRGYYQYQVEELHDYIFRWDTADGRSDSIRGRRVSTSSIEIIDNNGITYMFDYIHN